MPEKIDYSRQKHKVRTHGKSTPVICEKRMNGKRCIYCEQVAKLYQSEEQSDKDLASKCRARSTFYMNILDLKDKDTGIQVYGCGVENWRTLLDHLPDPEDPDDEGVDYTDPKSAKTVIIKRVGTGLKTEYTVSIGTKTIPIKPRLFKNLHPLHKIVELLSEDEVELWKPSPGKNRIYIFPPWSKKAEGDFYFEVVYHWSVDLLTGSKEDLDNEDGGWDDEGNDWGDDEDIPF